MVLRSADGERTLPAAEFQTGMLSTDREPEELIVAARFPTRTSDAKFAFGEVARRHGDFAIVALAARSENGERTLAVGGVADCPAVQSCPADDGELEDALNDLAWSLEAEDDIHATARHRRDIVRQLGAKLLSEVTT